MSRKKIENLRSVNWFPSSIVDNPRFKEIGIHKVLKSDSPIMGL